MPGGSRGVGRVIIIPVGAVVVAVLAAIAWFTLGPGADSGKPAGSPSAKPAAIESPEETAARQSRVCDAARRRVYAGASFGPFDTEGWVAELWLARKTGESLAKSATIQALVKSGKLTPEADAAIAAIPDGTVEIESGVPDDGHAGAVGYDGVTVRFGGRYAGAFLDPEMRPRFLALADRVSDSVGAETGALYARCAHLRYHDVGAWFRGSDPGAAVASLLYGVGAFAESVAIDREALAKQRASNELDGLRAAAGKIDARTVAALVGGQGGSIVSAKTGPALTIVFPPLAGTRAITASRSLASKIGVGTE
jgi:serine/threonine-protein kinase